MTNHVRIVMTEHGKGDVFLNGEKVKGIVGFEASGGVESINTVKLQIIASAVEIDMAEVEVKAGGHAESDDNDAMDNQE